MVYNCPWRTTLARKTSRKAAVSSDVDEKVRTIRRKTRKRYSSEDKIRIVLEGLRGEESVAELCRREGISESLCYKWSKEFLDAGKARLVGNTKRQASTDEVETGRKKGNVVIAMAH